MMLLFNFMCLCVSPRRTDHWIDELGKKRGGGGGGGGGLVNELLMILINSVNDTFDFLCMPVLYSNKNCLYEHIPNIGWTSMRL